MVERRPRGTGVPPVRIVQPTHGRDARATTRYPIEEREYRWLRPVRAAFIGGLISFQDTFHLTGDDEFFVRRNHEHFHARMRGADISFSGAGCVVLPPVEHDAELVEIRANRLAEFRAVLADAGGEND